MNISYKDKIFLKMGIKSFLMSIQNRIFQEQYKI